MVRPSMTAILQVTVLVSLIFFVVQILLYICHCRCKTDRIKKKQMMADAQVFDLLEKYEKDIAFLHSQIDKLDRELTRCQKIESYIVTDNLYASKGSFNDKTFLNSYNPRTEFEVIPYEAFTSHYLFGEIGFLSKKPTAAPIGQQAVEMKDILDHAVQSLNHDVESKADRVSLTNFAEGILRNDKTHGSVYDMYFRSPSSPDIFKRIKLLRPFTNLRMIGKPETLDTTQEWINLILPLSNRLDKFRIFMDQFIEVCIRRDRRIFLTIVYFGNDERQTVKDIVLNISKLESYEDYKVIFTEAEFNRGLGLQKGVESWNRGNAIMFFCDVDIYFTSDFLERCRLHTSPGSKVYYPIVFSQYNPQIVFGGQPPPPLREQIHISYDSGFWRDFGFGMTCQYRNDFLNIGGFDLSIRGWGGEDIALYKQHLRSKLTIIRAYDRSILHIYHTKNCRKTASDAQFISCLQSKAVSEGSHKQLGMLAFGTNLVSGTDPDWGQRLQVSLNGISNKNKTTR